MELHCNFHCGLSPADVANLHCTLRLRTPSSPNLAPTSAAKVRLREMLGVFMPRAQSSAQCQGGDRGAQPPCFGASLEGITGRRVREPVAQQTDGLTPEGSH
jgi:hypothetical protein